MYVVSSHDVMVLAGAMHGKGGGAIHDCHLAAG